MRRHFSRTAGRTRSLHQNYDGKHYAYRRCWCRFEQSCADRLFTLTPVAATHASPLEQAIVAAAKPQATVTCIADNSTTNFSMSVAVMYCCCYATCHTYCTLICRTISGVDRLSATFRLMTVRKRFTRDPARPSARRPPAVCLRSICTLHDSQRI